MVTQGNLTMENCIFSSIKSGEETPGGGDPFSRLGCSSVIFSSNPSSQFQFMTLSLLMDTCTTLPIGMWVYLAM